MRTLFLLLIVLFSCKQGTKKSVSEDTPNKPLTQESLDSSHFEKDIATIETKAVNAESFELFIRKYNFDSAFQIERTHLPLKVYSAVDFDSIALNYISENWIPLDFAYDSSAYYREIDAYKQVIVIDTDTARIGYHGIDNGIYMDYVFTLIDGKWFLDYMEDFSN